MALDAVISKDRHGKLSDELKKEYKEKGDQFFLDVTPSEIKDKDGNAQRFALEDVRGLKNSLQAAREEKSDLAKKNKAFEGLDAKEAKDAIAKLKEIGDGAGDEEAVKARLGSMKKELEEKHSEIVGKLKGDLKTLETDNSKLLIDDRISKALTGDGIKLIDGGAKLLTPFIKSQIKVTKDEATGERRALVIDPSTGKPRMSMESGNTDYMSVEEFVKSMAEDKDYGSIFRGDEKGGTKQKGETKPGVREQEPGPSKKDGILTKFRNPAARLMELRGRESESGG